MRAQGRDAQSRKDRRPNSIGKCAYKKKQTDPVIMKKPPSLLNDEEGLPRLTGFNGVVGAGAKGSGHKTEQYDAERERPLGTVAVGGKEKPRGQEIPSGELKRATVGKRQSSCAKRPSVQSPSTKREEQPKTPPGDREQAGGGTRRGAFLKREARKRSEDRVMGEGLTVGGGIRAGEVAQAIKGKKEMPIREIRVTETKNGSNTNKRRTRLSPTTRRFTSRWPSCIAIRGDG